MEYVSNQTSFLTRPFSGYFRAFFSHLADHFLPHHRNNYHPHVFKNSSLALLSGLLITVKIFSFAALSFAPVENAFSSAISSNNIIALTNSSRKVYGLSELKENKKLTLAAQAKAEDMLQNQYFAHTSPDGKTPWSFVEGAGYAYLSAGENLAVNFTESEDVESAWMNSPSHKANILNSEFEEIGIGIALGEYKGKSTIFVVQMFGTAALEKIAFTDTPTQVQTQAVPEPVILNENVLGETALEIKSFETFQDGSDLVVKATVSGAPVKMLASFGSKAAMLEPKAENIWEGRLNFSSLTNSRANLSLKAFDIHGQTAHAAVANFSGSTLHNYQILTPEHPEKASFFGKVFEPKVLENQFYLLFVAGILFSLILALAIKRHVQHLGLVVNGSAVAIFATLMWVV